ncbi:hypothetical protein RFI_40269, partial [Reticulomyxa filosa]
MQSYWDKQLSLLQNMFGFNKETAQRYFQTTSQEQFKLSLMRLYEKGKRFINSKLKKEIIQENTSFDSIYETIEENKEENKINGNKDKLIESCLRSMWSCVLSRPSFEPYPLIFTSNPQLNDEIQSKNINIKKERSGKDKDCEQIGYITWPTLIRCDTNEVLSTPMSVCCARLDHIPTVTEASNNKGGDGKKEKDNRKEVDNCGTNSSGANNSEGRMNEVNNFGSNTLEQTHNQNGGSTLSSVAPDMSEDGVALSNGNAHESEEKKDTKIDETQQTETSALLDDWIKEYEQMQDKKHSVLFLFNKIDCYDLFFLLFFGTRVLQQCKREWKDITEWSNRVVFCIAHCAFQIAFGKVIDKKVVDEKNVSKCIVNLLLEKNIIVVPELQEESKGLQIEPKLVLRHRRFCPIDEDDVGTMVEKKGEPEKNIAYFIWCGVGVSSNDTVIPLSKSI